MLHLVAAGRVRARRDGRPADDHRGGRRRRWSWDAPEPGFVLRDRAARARRRARSRRARAAGRITSACGTTSCVHGTSAVTAKDLDVYRRCPPEVIAAGTVGSTRQVPQRNLEVPLRLLCAMTVFVLLVAAGNVANLLASAGARRGHEMAVSLALGARRWDLLRPRLVEALALALMSGAAALLLAAWTGDLVPSLLGMGEELAGVNTRPDVRVVVFTAGMSVLTGLLIWLASALLVTRRAALPSLVAGRADATGRRPGAALRRGLVIVQVSLSLALVCTAALFGRSLANVLAVDPGFDAEHVVGFTVNPGAAGYDGDRLEHYLRTLVDQSRALPGVSRVALSSVMPLSGGLSSTEVTGPRQQAGRGDTQYADVMVVSPDFFATIGLGLASGRTFDDRDVKSAPRVVIVNESAARLLVDGSEVVGQMIGYPGAPASLRDRRRCARRTQPAQGAGLAHALPAAGADEWRRYRERAPAGRASRDGDGRRGEGDGQAAGFERGRIDLRRPGHARARRAHARADAGGAVAGVRGARGPAGGDGPRRPRERQRHAPHARDRRPAGARSVARVGAAARAARSGGPDRRRNGRRPRALPVGEPRPAIDAVRDLARRPCHDRPGDCRTCRRRRPRRPASRPSGGARRSGGDVAVRMSRGRSSLRPPPAGFGWASQPPHFLTRRTSSVDSPVTGIVMLAWATTTLPEKPDLLSDLTRKPCLIAKYQVVVAGRRPVERQRRSTLLQVALQGPLGVGLDPRALDPVDGLEAIQRVDVIQADEDVPFARLLGDRVLARPRVALLDRAVRQVGEERLEPAGEVAR